MYLLVDSVSLSVTLVLFDAEREVIAHEVFPIAGKEFDHFLESIETFLQAHEVTLPTLQGIVAVSGPAPFTSIRIITLTLGSLALAHGMPLYSVTYFDLAAAGGANYPIIVRANRDEYAVVSSTESPMTLIRKAELVGGNYFGVWDESDFASGEISVQSGINYDQAVKNLDFGPPHKQIEPLYIKKPNIT